MHRCEIKDHGAPHYHDAGSFYFQEPPQHTIDSSGDGGKHEDEEEVEAKECEGGCPLRLGEVVEEASIGNDADSKEVLGKCIRK